MRPRKFNYMDPENKSALSDHIEIPIMPQLQTSSTTYRQAHIRRTVIIIPSKCIGQSKVTHEILIRFNWSRLSLFMTAIAITIASVTLIVLLLT